MRRAEEHNLMVCERCLMGIESHEGKQFTRKYFPDLEEESGTCEWCEDSGFDTLYELI